MITLRPDQQDFVERLRISMRTNRVVVACAPTGFGKTIIASHIAQSAVSKGRASARTGAQVMMTVHRSYLVDQTQITFDKFGLDYGVISAGRARWNPYRSTQIASIDTLSRRLDRLKPPPVLLVDEGHHAVSASWRKTIDWAVAGGSRVVLFSATPERLDGRGLGEIATDIVLGPSTDWLITNGHLCKYRAYAPNAPDLEGVRTTAGDFNQGDLSGVMDKSRLIGDMVRHWRQFGDGLRSVYFCVSIAHSQHVAEAFRAAGVPALHLDGDTPAEERFAAARALGRGELKVLTNAALISEGADLAAWAGMDVSIELVGLARPTQSVALHLQQIGRALRNSAGKSHAVIIDHAGNLRSLGLPDDPRQWSLEGRKRSKSSEATEPSVRICESCFGAYRATVRACPHCGHAPAVQVRQIEHVDGELQEIDVAEMRRQRKMQEHAARSVGDLIEVGRARGYAKPEAWAAHLWTARQSKRRQFQKVG